MMLPTIDPNIKYIAVILFLLGVFLIISGLNIIKVEKISVSSGKKTWMLGVFLTSISTIMLLPEFTRDFSKEGRKIEITTLPNSQSLMITTLPQSVERAEENKKNISLIPVEATIEYPHDGMKVNKKVIVKGKLLAASDINAYLVIESKKFGGIYPQGKIQVDANNKFVMPVIYGSSGHKYRTYIVVTNDENASKYLENEHYRKYGMSKIPIKSKVASKKILYLAEF